MNSRTVITLSTIPSRAAEIIPVLQSLLRQKPDKLYLWSPRIFKRRNQPGDLPPAVVEFCQEHQEIHAELVDDYGPITKLLPVLKYETAADTRIIVTDDDSLIIHPEWRSELERYGTHDTAVAYAGTHLIRHRNPWIALGVANHLAEVDLIEAYCGYIVRRGWFDDAFVRLIEYLSSNLDIYQDLICADDLIVSYYLRHIGISTRVVWTNAVHRHNVVKFASYSKRDALHMMYGTPDSNLRNYEAAHQALTALLNERI